MQYLVPRANTELCRREQKVGYNWYCVSEETLKLVGIVIRFLCNPVMTWTKSWTPLPDTPSCCPPAGAQLIRPCHPHPLQLPLQATSVRRPLSAPGRNLLAAARSSAPSRTAGRLWGSIKPLPECDCVSLYRLILIVCYHASILECKWQYWRALLQVSLFKGLRQVKEKDVKWYQVKIITLFRMMKIWKHHEIHTQEHTRVYTRTDNKSIYVCLCSRGGRGRRPGPTERRPAPALTWASDPRQRHSHEVDLHQARYAPPLPRAPHSGAVMKCLFATPRPYLNITPIKHCLLPLCQR